MGVGGGGEGGGGVVGGGDRLALRRLRRGGGGERGLYGAHRTGLLGVGRGAGGGGGGHVSLGAGGAAAAASGPPFQTGRLGCCWLGGVEGASWVAGGGAASARGAGSGNIPAAARLEGHCWASSLPTRMGERHSRPKAGQRHAHATVSPTVAATASLSPREAACSTNLSSCCRCSAWRMRSPSLPWRPQRVRARAHQASILLATRTYAHILLARCFWLRRLEFLARWAGDLCLGTPCALAVAGLARLPAGCWLACGAPALANCEASALMRSLRSHSCCAA